MGDGKCSVCDQGASRYTCPACEIKTCSLACVKAHKEANGCSGKRDRTAFVGRGTFDERAFMSDYRFLEEVQRADDVAKRSRPPAPKLELPPHLRTLVVQAGRRGVQLHILPPGMEKRKNNSMRFDGRAQTLSWHVEWAFPAAGKDGKPVRVADARVNECARLRELLAAHLTLAPGEALVHEELAEHLAAGAAGLTVLLRRERSPANAVEYHLIDTEQTVGQALQGKVIVEYPTFLVLLPREVGQYRLVGQEAAPQQPAGAAAAAPEVESDGKQTPAQQRERAQQEEQQPVSGRPAAAQGGAEPQQAAAG